MQQGHVSISPSVLLNIPTEHVTDDTLHMGDVIRPSGQDLFQSKQFAHSFAGMHDKDLPKTWPGGLHSLLPPSCVCVRVGKLHRIAGAHCSGRSELLRPQHGRARAGMVRLARFRIGNSSACYG